MPVTNEEWSQRKAWRLLPTAVDVRRRSLGAALFRSPGQNPYTGLSCSGVGILE